MEIIRLQRLPRYILWLLLGAFLPATAQELNESMTVQGAYDPVIRKHERLSGLPQRPELTLSEAALPAAEKGITLSVDPQIAPFGALVNPLENTNSYNGYIDLSAGSYLNTNLSAGYKFLHTNKSLFGAWLQHNSSSLFRANEYSPYRRSFDERIGAYDHRIFSPGTLSLSADYLLSYYNYYRRLTPENHDVPQPGTQTINAFSAKAMWQGSNQEDGFNYSVGFDYNYFGYRRLYEWTDYAYKSMAAPRENSFKLSANLGYNFNNAHSVNLALSGQRIGYTNSSVSDPGFYSFTPSYHFISKHFQTRVGARIDLTSNIDAPHEFADFHIAPDVALNYTAAPFTMSLEATGGVVPNTLRSAHELFYYSMPAIMATTPTFTPLNAKLRIALGNIKGFSVGLNAQYASSKNVPLEGLYPLYLFSQLTWPVSYQLYPNYIDIHGFALGADMSFSMGDYISLRGDLTYSPQKANRGVFNGIDRPRWIITAEASTKPIQGLRIALGYDYRGVRNLYYRANPMAAITPMRLRDFTNLYLRADYTFLQRYTAGISLDNILGCDAGFSPEQPHPGIAISGRFSILF